MNFGATLFSAVFTGLLLGLSYRGPPAQPATPDHVRDMTGLFFLANLMAVLISAYAAIVGFSAETKVFMRENQAGVNRCVLRLRCIACCIQQLAWPDLMGTRKGEGSKRSHCTLFLTPAHTPISLTHPSTASAPTSWPRCRATGPWRS